MRVRVTHLVSRGAWLVATVIIVASLAKSASAAPLIFLDRDVFDIAAHPQTISFDAVAPGDCVFDPSNFTCNHTFDDLLFVSYDIAGIGLLGDSLGLGFFAGQQSFHQFLTPVTAIGFDLVGITPGGPGGPPAAEFSFAGVNFGLPYGYFNSPIFLGAIFDAPLSAIPAQAVGVPGPALPLGFVIQNLEVTTVPEPATFLLFGTAASALVGFGRFVSRRRIQ
jgi:PEP-CTERM motif-containing protein